MVHSVIIPKKRWIFLILLNFLFILGITIFLTLWLRREIAKEQWNNFLSETNAITVALNERLHVYDALLYSEKGLIDSNNANITPLEWHTYVSALNLSKNYPAVATVGYGFLVTQAEKANFITQQRAEVNKNFTITPPGNRPLYAVGTYVEPPSLAAEGVDSLVDPVRAKSIEEAISTGEITVSGKTTLYIDTVKVPAFVMRLVFYKQKEASGYVTATFRMQDLIQVALQHNFQGVRFAVYDGTDTKNLSSSRLFYNNLPSSWQTSGRFSRTITIPILAHGWTIIFTDTSILNLRDRFAPAIILIVGVILAIVSTFLLYFLIIRKRAAENLAQKMTEELRKSVEKLNEDKEKLEEATTKDEFLSMAAHELRTPLGTMRWRMEDMLSDNKIKLSPSTKENIQKIYGNVLRLIHIVNNLLDVSRINQEKVIDNPEGIDVVTLTQNVLETMQDRITEKDLKVSFKSSKTIPMKIDQNLLEEVLANIISNAVKYSKKKGKLDIGLTVSKEDLIITVSDTGIGIPLKDQKHIFEKFKRGSNVDVESIEGNGLGLFLVKKYIDHWKGKISIDSVLDKGTKVTIAIPREIM